MELKTARLTLLIDPNKKAAFERLCSQLDLTPSQVVRQLIRDYLAQHGASYTPSGLDGEEAPPASPQRGAAAKPGKPARAARAR
ncbi:CopG family transcriptional regulator [Ideonella sp.]|uniref:CopG family transcriptional regulator n=1 Tax=Ideonella sp. TaxID=1929293 RepID=UPI0035B429E4